MKCLFALAALSLLVVACDNDDNGNKDKNPEPSSVTLLDSQATMAADGTFTVNFRVEPTSYVVTKDAVGLIATTWESPLDILDNGMPVATVTAIEAGQSAGAIDPGHWVAHCKMNSTTGFEWAGMKLTVYTYDKNHNLQAATEASGVVRVSMP